MIKPEVNKKAIKYVWAALLSFAVAGLAITEKDSQWRPLLNGLIDMIQNQPQGGKPLPPASGLLPQLQVPFKLPSWREVLPAAAPPPAATAPDVAP
jgi:hypothetical protein